MNRHIPIAVAALAFSITSHADWLHYRGPAGNAVTEALATVPAEAKTLWKAELGLGTTSFVVEKGRVFTMGNVDKNDVIYCLDAATGKEIWTHKFPQPVDPNLFEGGPRSTPTLDAGRVYTISAYGDLWCLDAATGKKVWLAHIAKDFGGVRPEWGYSGSPTIVGDRLFLDAGGDAGTIALDKKTGKLLWKSGAQKAGYATSVIAKLAGAETLLTFASDQLLGLDPATGKTRWSLPWKTSYDINAATPIVVSPDTVFITSGYNRGCALVRVTATSASIVWENKHLRAHVNTPVFLDGHLYGVDGNTGGGNLVCLDIATGERKWEEKSVKGGALVLAGKHLIIISEKGELVIADASPTGFKAALRTPLLSARVWAQPTLVDGRLFARTNTGTTTCVSLGAK